MTRWILKFGSYKKPDDIFEKVISGKKTIETRQRDPESNKDYSKVKVGDVLVMESTDSGREIEKTVVFVHIYDSVLEMVEREDPEAIFPGVGSSENLLNVYNKLKKKWGKNYAQKLEKYGIVAIGFK